MRTKTKKQVAWATVAQLTMVAFVAVFTALVISCPMPSEEGYKPPPGKGAVQINFGDILARELIMPDDADITWFNQFWLQFTPVAGAPPLGGTAVDAYPLNTSTMVRNARVVLDPGTYTLDAVGFKTAGNSPYTAPVDKPTVPGAVATVTGIVVTAGSVIPVTVTLKPFMDTGTDYDAITTRQNGTFTWKIDATAITSAYSLKIKIDPISGSPTGSSTVAEKTITVNNSATPESLAAGYYYVRFVLQVGSVTREFLHILHVYANMNSTFEYTFTENQIGIASTSVAPTIEYEHPVDHELPIVVSATGATGNGTKATPYVITIGAAANGDRITLTATLTGFDAGSTEWYVDGVQRVTTDGYTIVAGTTLPFNVASDVPYQVMAMATRTEGTVTLPYSSKEIFIEVHPGP